MGGGHERVTRLPSQYKGAGGKGERKVQKTENDKR